MPGQTTVRAKNGDIEGSTTLTLWYAQVRFAPGAPDDAPEIFASAAAGGSAPELLYPPDGTLIPPNLTILDVQFRPGSGNPLGNKQAEGFPGISTSSEGTCLDFGQFFGKLKKNPLCPAPEAAGGNAPEGYSR